MLNFIDNFLNRITMYRLMLYYLFALILAGFALSFFGVVPFKPQDLAFSAIVLTIACLGFNWLLARFFGAITNNESSYITAFILTLIITPPAFAFGSGVAMPALLQGAAFLLFAALFAMASKYVLTWGFKQIFNPAAIAVVLTSLVFGSYASWWVGGNNYLLPFVLIGGFLVVRKLQRFDLVLTFIAAALVSIFITGNSLPLDSVQKALLHTTIFFVAFVMLTEPATTPPARWLRICYGALVGLLFSPAIHLGPFNSTPELALIIGNIFSFAVSPKTRALLKLKGKQQIASTVWEFIFEKPRGLSFEPGQYMEWTLPSGKDDQRGNRRYFTVASSPTEPDVRLGVRIESPEHSSSFKKKLVALKPGEHISAGQLTGEFTLPHYAKQKLAFIAGGIGITPMRSMLKYLSDKGEKRDAILLYSVRTDAEAAYHDILQEAQAKVGVRVRYVVTGELATAGASRRIDGDTIKAEIPDWQERTFYISGTHAMTDGLKTALLSMGVPRSRIKVDFFPGFV